MRIERPLGRRRRISMTPLVDIIFLLLLFFMLSSTFTTFGYLELGAPAGTGGSGGVPNAFVAVDETGIRVNGARVALEDLAEEARKLSETGAETVLVLPRSRASTQQLVDVMDALKKASNLSVIVAR